MTDSRRRTLQRLYVAVGSLASGTGSIQDRLYNAYVPIAPLELEDFPNELRSEVELIRREFGVEPTGDESSVKATINGMSSEEASGLEEKILKLYDAIAQ